MSDEGEQRPSDQVAEGEAQADAPASSPGPVARPFDDGSEAYPSGVGGPAPPLVLRMGWSWGALLAGWLWAVCNGVWIGLLDLVLMANPVIWVAFRLVLGGKGNEWAWQNRRFGSVAHFARVQRRWAQFGGLVLAAQLALMLLLFVHLGQLVHVPTVTGGG
jgi:hypothetical protein